eukprot:CAMPEP_0178374050 /NCGR_PEP_ID=MMETSP0689_2-20121128/2179_1 /TAXON_ID=160604 /ORGANISM="Amphidinium massartii, Strain CS-259" /LENGTH=247 /DNA_ID=CAMNT_0019994013 /DNA_START=62 /DNA_END=803 /DNA_ORIENTATION=+
MADPSSEPSPMAVQVLVKAAEATAPDLSPRLGDAVGATSPTALGTEVIEGPITPEISHWLRVWAGDDAITTVTLRANLDAGGNLRHFANNTRAEIKTPRGGDTIAMKDAHPLPSIMSSTAHSESGARVQCGMWSNSKQFACPGTGEAAGVFQAEQCLPMIDSRCVAHGMGFVGNVAVYSPVPNFVDEAPHVAGRVQSVNVKSIAPSVHDAGIVADAKVGSILLLGLLREHREGPISQRLEVEMLAWA